jgi:hypothetical protein
MKEGSLHIQLVKVPVQCHGDGEVRVEGFDASDRQECFIIIEASNLREALHNNVDLLFDNCTGCILFEVTYCLAFDDMFPFWY